MYIKKYSCLAFVIVAFISLKMYSGNVHPTDNSTVRFTENKNQWDKCVLYKAQLDGGAMYLEKNCFTYSFYDKEQVRKSHVAKDESSNQTGLIKTQAFRMTFLNALPTVKVTAKNATPDYCNYFIGNDKKKWAENVKNYREINYTNLFPHINLQIIGQQNSLKYNFFVSPQGNAADIKMSYTGINSIFVEKGVLKIKTNINEINEQRPYAYQMIGGKKVEVPCEFELDKETVYFKFSKGYNREIELIIDPLLVFACSSGSLADNFGMTATYDSRGNLYSGGTAFGFGYPTTKGAYDETFNGSTKYVYGRTDVVITKYDSIGKTLIYSTYLGGDSSTEVVTSLVVDQLDNLLLYGATGSYNFPITTGAYDSVFNGGPILKFTRNGTYFNNGTDIYVAKFNSLGTKLLASTFIGGNLNDGVNYGSTLQYNYGDQYRGEINVDKQGNVYIASSTQSSDFPTDNGYYKTLKGKQDAVVFKLNPTLSKMIWSTYLGGENYDAGFALALDDNSNVYVTGGTLSTDFPMKGSPIQGTLKGVCDGYITKIKNDGKDILASTFWGTDKYDQSYFVQLDESKSVYVIGQSAGKMPVTPGVYNNPNSSQFITKMDSSLSTVIFSTVFGNGKSSPNLSPSAFLVDDCQNIYVSGWGGNIEAGTPLHDMPLTPDARPDPGDGFNFYLFVISKNAEDLLYATYFGGDKSQEHVDGGTSRFDKKGIIYQSVCAGCGDNDDFPVFPADAWPNKGADVNQNVQIKDGCNNGTFKINFKVPGPLTDFKYEQKDSCAPLIIRFKTETPSKKVLWDFGNNDTTSKRDPVRTYTIPGKYNVKLYIYNVLNCYVWDTVLKVITVHESIGANFDYIAVPCTKDVTFSDSSYVTPVSWNWYFGDGTTSTLKNPPKHTFGNQSSYNVILAVKNKYGCIDSVEHQITFADSTIAVNPAQTICLGNSAMLLATGGDEYSWLPVIGLNNANIPNPVATPATNTTYTVHIKFINSFGDSCSADLSTVVTVIDITTVLLNATADKDTLLKGESTTLHAVTNSGLSIQWTPTAGVSNPTAYNTQVTPDKTTTYTVTIVGASGCIKSDTVTIYILSNECEDESVFVPNTFTPNGDGENDVLYARSNNLTSAYFAVYNRWGELVFETTDFHKGWDGIYKGMKADPAVFAWYLKGRCFNGKELFKKGNVTLIR